MIDLRPIVHLLGLLLVGLAAAMAVPAAVDGLTGSSEWKVFAETAGLTLFVGGGAAIASRCDLSRIGVREAFLLTTLSWIVVTLFAGLPFMLMEPRLSFTDSFFEAMSGLTTTGATVIVGLDRLPPGILLWRGLLQWLGGIGIIVMAIAILPALRIGGMQLFRMESSDRSDKIMPRAREIAGGIGGVYLALSAAVMAGYWMAGMSAFDAVVHTMATVSTGGFANYDRSFSDYGPAIQWLAVGGMIAGALPFLQYVRAVRGHPAVLWHDPQIRLFALLLALFVAIPTVQLMGAGRPFAEAVRLAAFNVTSVVTTTGFVSAPFDNWGPFAMPLFFFLMFVGGCAGSSTAGIKMFRFAILFEAARAQLHRMMRPHGVFAVYYDGRPVAESDVAAVQSFLFLYAVVVVTLAFALGLMGLDILTALSAVASAIGNVGPGLGPIVGPDGNYSTLPDGAIWLLSFAMLLGRLEMLTVLVILTPFFWRR